MVQKTIDDEMRWMSYVVRQNKADTIPVSEVTIYLKNGHEISDFFLMFESRQKDGKIIKLDWCTATRSELFYIDLDEIVAIKERCVGFVTDRELTAAGYSTDLIESFKNQ